MSAVETLCGIIAQRGKASKASYQPMDGFRALQNAGLIHDDGKLQSVYCDACDNPHSAEVIFESSRYGHFCPEAGLVKLAPDSIDAIKPDVRRLVDALSDVLACKRRKSTAVAGDTWRIGALNTPDGQLTVYFHPVLGDEQDADDLQSALGKEIRSQFRLVLTASGTLSIDGVSTALLGDVLEVSDTDASFTFSTNPCSIVGAQEQASPGRPSPFKDDLSILIFERIASGAALPGRNEEAHVLRELHEQKHPQKKLPSIPTIRRHLTRIRAGS